MVRTFVKNIQNDTFQILCNNIVLALINDCKFRSKSCNFCIFLQFDLFQKKCIAEALQIYEEDGSKQ